MAQDGFFSFVKRNWVAYLVGAVLAILLGLGLSFYLGAKWSTPQALKSERVAARQNEADFTPEADDLVPAEPQGSAE